MSDALNAENAHNDVRREEDEQIILSFDRTIFSYLRYIMATNLLLIVFFFNLSLCHKAFGLLVLNLVYLFLINISRWTSGMMTCH